METHKILIVADNSPLAIKVIEYGFGFAKQLGASVTLLCVVETALAMGNVDAGIFPDDALTSLKTKTADFLTRMKNTYSNGINTEILFPEGDTQTLVINTATKCKASLIVAGRYGHPGLGQLFNASVAEYIIHHSAVPVCIVPLYKPTA